VRGRQKKRKGGPRDTKKKSSSRGKQFFKSDKPPKAGGITGDKVMEKRGQIHNQSKTSCPKASGPDRRFGIIGEGKMLRHKNIRSLEGRVTREGTRDTGLLCGRGIRKNFQGIPK